MRRKLVWIIPLAVLGMAAFIVIGGEIVMHLWNWLLPPLFGWRVITFWQALGLLVLSRILFGGFGMHGGSGGHRGWRKRMEERCDRMSPEEQEKFRQKMRERWGLGAAGAEAKDH